MTFRFFMLFASLCAASFSPHTMAQTDVRLSIDAKQQAGPVPYMYRAGVFVGSLPIGYPKEKFFSDQRPGMLQLSWQVHAPLLNTRSEQEFFDRLPESNLTAWVRAAAAAGAEPHILLMPIPRWLRAGGDAGRHKLPADLPGWERFVQRMVDYYNNQLKIDVQYVVWDEPNVFFDGTTEDYLLIYKHAAAGLLRANPKARIGGPAVSVFYGDIQPVKGKATKPLLPAFVRYCATTPLPGLAQRLPIDSLNWHIFNAAPVKSGEYDIEVQAARTLLRENGYSENTDITIGSWSVLDKYPEVQLRERDSQFLSAYIVASVIAMQRAGVTRHAFFNLFEDWMGTKEEFGNDEGLMTRNYIVKAGYNAFRLLGRLQGTQVAVDVPDPLVQAAAATDGRTMRLIAANFAPPAAMVKARAQKQVRAAGYTRDQLAAALPPGEKLDEVLKDRSRIESLRVPPDVRAAGLQLHDLVKLSNVRQREPVSLQVVVNGLPSGHYQLSEYRIDANSANAYAMRGQIDEAKLQQAKRAGRAAARDYLAQRWTPQQMAEAQKLIQTDDLGNIMDHIRSLPPEKKRDVDRAFETMREVQFAPVKKINEGLDPRPQNVSKVTIDGTGTLRLTLPPYGVILLELERL